MSWTAPRDWTTGYVVTSGDLNTHVRDNMLALRHPHTFSAADIDVVSTVNETSLGSILIAASSLGINGMVELFQIGDFLYNNNTADTLVIRFKFGGVTVASVANAMSGEALSASRKSQKILVQLVNDGATNAQILYYEVQCRRGAENEWYGHGTAAIDTTADQTLDVTAQWSASSANNSWKRLLTRAYLEQAS